MLKVVQISDTHIRAQPNSRLWHVDVDRGLAAVLEHVQTHHWPADFVLATGDLTQDEGLPAYRRLRSFLEPLQVPVYCLPGNHDFPAALDEALAGGPVRRERQVLTDYWQFVLLDSSLPDSAAGHLANAELQFLQSALQTYPERHTVVCLHHHPVSVGSAWMDTMIVDNAAALFEVLDEHRQVRAMVWGHIHQAFSGRRKQVELFGVPSTCAQFKAASQQPKIDEHMPPGYRWFKFYDDGRLETAVERVPIDSD